MSRLEQECNFDRGIGWLPELPDHRDFIYSAQRVAQIDASLAIKPHHTAARFRTSQLTDQRQTNACVGHSTSRHWQTERKLSARSPLDPYWKAREYRGWTNQDEGAYIRDAFKMLSAKGCTRDDLYPDTNENVFKAPSEKALDDADNRLPVSYFRIDSDDSGDREQVKRRILACLSTGHTFVGGVTCYTSLFAPRTSHTGIVPMPGPSEKEYGGHALQFGEYDLNFKASKYAQEARNRGFPESELVDEVVTCANSWGRQYGQDGYYFFPLDYLIDRMLCDDCWTTRAK